VDEEAVEHARQLLDRAQVHLEEEAVLAGDAMALGHLGDLGGELGDPLQLPGRRLDAHDRGQLVPERAGIDLGAVAGEPVITPTRSRRCTRSAAAGAERLTRRPSSANGIRPSATSSPMILRSVASNFPTYALFVALLPATATAIGVVVLRQLPSAVDLGGIGLVMARVALHREQSRR
jgi:hypothetical protein